ncbi:MAG: hypothetical protein IAG13_17615 [Deltaproteobacteria bacterium]|nr:hypothetical protein [Nannocystaceae bacterium]
MSVADEDDRRVRLRSLGLTVPELDAVLAFAPRVAADCQPGVEDELVSLLYSHRWIVPFSWPEWHQGLAMERERAPLDDVDLAHVIKLVTAHMRQDRFFGGHLRSVLTSGRFAEILGRLGSIRSQLLHMPDYTAADLDRFKVLVMSDSPYQASLRLHQARWRERNGLAIGEYRGREYGNFLRMPDAERTLANYLTDEIRGVVRREVLERDAGDGRLFGRPRIFNNLLSSQPLCFNVFAPLALDLELATRVVRALDEDLEAMSAEVTAVRFEHSPARRDPRYTGDRSAFDVFFEYRAGDRRGFLGIEVKYHEDLDDDEATISPRHEKLAAVSGAFKAERLVDARRRPLHQLWRDHLLALAMLAADDYDEGRFVVVFPRHNLPCAAAVIRYRDCLVRPESFGWWTLEALFASLELAGAGREWIGALHDRYAPRRE